MTNIKRLAALLLALVMVLGMSSMTWATVPPAELTGGEVGGFNSGHVDDPQVQEKTINIQKQITAYNPDENYIYGPEITYTYSIVPAADNSGSGGVNELVSITDEMADHTSGVATVFNPVLAGVGTPGLTGTETSKIVWTNADILEASSEGVANIKNLKVDFSNIVFSQPGVYRYKISESVTYDNTGVTDGGISNVRYLDVYVMRSADFNPTHDGTTGNEYVSSDWSIYGYVCISPESVAENAGGSTAVTPSTKKTNGFVPETVGENSYTADEYYTYNFTVTKDLVGDNTMIDHQFPLTVAFSDGPTGKFQLIAETDGSKSSLNTTTVDSGAATVNFATGITGASATTAALKKVGGSDTFANFGNAGSPQVADGNTTTGETTGYIKYIGIPNTTVVTVTEENDIVGTTYQASVKEDVTTDNASALAAVNMTRTTGTMGKNGTIDVASIDNTETATRTAASNGAANTLAKNIDIQFTNTLAIISPTGVVMRIAPYALMLAAGIALFIVFIARRRRKDDEE